MRQTHVIRYLVVATLLLLLAACGQLPRHAHLHAAAAGRNPARRGDAPAPAPAAAPDLAQQVQNLEARVQQLESHLAQLETPERDPVASKARAVPPPPPPAPPNPRPPRLRVQGRKKITPKACASITPRNMRRPRTSFICT